MKNLMIIVPLALSLLTGAAFAAGMKADGADDASAMMGVDSAGFVKTVMSSNAFEIESSKLAEQKASGAQDIDAFAKQMIEDHTTAGEELNAALQKSGVSAPSAAELAPKHAAMLKQLQSADGKDFAMLYIDMQAGAHMEAVSLFGTYAKAGDDPALKAFAMKTLPTLEMHKDHVKKLVAAH